MKGTIVIVIGTGIPIPPNFAEGFILPEGYEEYLDGTIHVLPLPEGGSIHIGKAGVEVLNDIHQQIHNIVE